MAAKKNTVTDITPVTRNTALIDHPQMLKLLRNFGYVVKDMTGQPKTSPAIVQFHGDTLSIILSGYRGGVELTMPAHPGKWDHDYTNNGVWEKPVFVDVVALMAAIGKLGTGPVLFTVGDTPESALTISQSPSAWTIPGGYPADHPGGFPWDPEKETKTFTMVELPRYFWDSLSKVCDFAGTDDTLPILTSVNLERNGGRMLTCAATDRYRMVIQSFLTRGPAGGKEVLNLPAKVLKTLAKTGLSLPHDHVTILQQAGSPEMVEIQLVLGLGTDIALPVLRCWTRAEIGEFPKVASLSKIPEGGQSLFIDDIPRLVAALKIASSRANVATLTNANGALQLVTGTYRYTVGDAQLGDDRIFEVSVNPVLLMDALGLFVGGSTYGVTLQQEGKNKPLFVLERRELWPDVATHPPLALVMPVRGAGEQHGVSPAKAA